MEQNESIKIKIQQREIPDFRGYVRPIISEFIDVLEKNFPEDVVNHFYQNIRTLKLVKKKRMPSQAVGAFNRKKNEILYKDDATEELDYTLFHEFFHLASCHEKKVGFHDYTVNRGWGINEGFTEFLTVKYFGLDEDSVGYLFEISVVNVLNSILGEEKMTGLYMNANYLGLSLSLEHYLDRKQSDDFIRKLDHFTFVTTDLPFLQNLFLMRHYISSLTKDISSFLAKMYIKKNLDTLQCIPYQDEAQIRNFYWHYRDIINQNIPMDFLPLEYGVDESFLLSYLEEMGYSLPGWRESNNKIQRGL
ncbi:MAG: hypothetical protein IJI60_02735 [Bacilli bacterium]|nr:hypothetical protein [Bacilli bacterium]